MDVQLIRELVTLLNLLDADPRVRVIVLTGSDKAFAAGADIREMATRTVAEMAKKDNSIADLGSVTRGIRKPIVAAVNGFALGGGCELAMSCDIIVAGSNARFGQPEVKIGTIPGAGGTQRLTRAVGKSKAMEMVLTGAPITAEQAEKFGLVSTVVAPEKTVETALLLANQIARHSLPVVAAAKDCVQQAFETTLDMGLRYELRAFHTTFGLADQKEGMDAFAGKRTPQWADQ